MLLGNKIKIQLYVEFKASTRSNEEVIMNNVVKMTDRTQAYELPVSTNGVSPCGGNIIMSKNWGRYRDQN